MRLFVILSRIPYPLDKGDKLRAYHQLRELSKRHEVILCCLHDETPHPRTEEILSSISSEFHLFRLQKWRIFFRLLFGVFSRKPFQVLYFHQRPIHKSIRRLIADRDPDHIYCQLIRTAEYAKDEHDHRKTIDFQDAFSKGMERRARLARGLKREIFTMERNRVIAYENIIFEYFERKTIISEEDRRYIYHPERDKIHVVTNGIDTDYFRPDPSAKPRYDLVFVGNMGYSPNVETAVYIVEQVLPVLRKSDPDVQLLIAGATPSRRIRQLAEQPGVSLMANPEDIRGAYLSGRVFFAPMQIGTGLQNKLLEAMSLGLPCVTSPLANKALRAPEDEVVLCADTPEGYAKHIRNLLTDGDRRKRLGAGGREFVRSRFSWVASTQNLEAILEGRKP